MGPKPAAMKAMKSLPKGTPKAKAKAKATLTKGSKATLTKRWQRSQSKSNESQQKYFEEIPASKTGEDDFGTKKYKSSRRS